MIKLGNLKDSVKIGRVDSGRYVAVGDFVHCFEVGGLRRNLCSYFSLSYFSLSSLCSFFFSFLRFSILSIFLGD